MVLRLCCTMGRPSAYAATRRTLSSYVQVCCVTLAGHAVQVASTLRSALPHTPALSCATGAPAVLANCTAKVAAWAPSSIMGHELELFHIWGSPGRKQWSPLCSWASSWSHWLRDRVCISAALANSMLARCQAMSCCAICLASAWLPPFFLCAPQASRGRMQRRRTLVVCRKGMSARCQAWCQATSCCASCQASETFILPGTKRA